MQAFLPDLSESLGVFIPLIVVNCIILGRAEAFASKNGVLASAMDGLFQGIGYTVALSLMCIVREFLGNGTFGGGLLADRLGYVKVIRVAFFCMVPTYLFLTHTTDIWVATALLVPAAVSIFMPYSPIVVLGQTYLAKNAGFASGVTLGLTTTLGGIFAPLVGGAADRWGLVPALQIFWIAGLIGLIAAFFLPEPEKE
jgi:FSR family fosmidomycin resistance protein-like MFS transporter